MVDSTAQPHGPALSNSEKPAVLIIGGLGILLLHVPNPTCYINNIRACTTLSRSIYPGYIGRFIALHIHRNALASEVRLVDKVLPQLAWLAPEFSEACSQDKFMQADAGRERAWPHLLLISHAHYPGHLMHSADVLEQNRSPESSLAQMARSSTTSSTAAARHATPRTTASTKCVALTSP